MAVFFERSNRYRDEPHGAGEVIRRCGLCQDSDMVLRRNRDGNFMVGCLGFPQCRNAVWLPGCVIEATVTRSVCNSCNPGPIYLIQFKFRQLEIPPGFGPDHLGCIGGCDNTLRELVEICGTGSRIAARGRAPTSTPNVGQRSNRTFTCVYCGQTGHSSSDCPSQTSSRNNRTSTAPQNGEPSVPCGTCGMPCTLRTANTENNRGRKFYKCPSQECNFFVWEDSLNTGGGISVRRTNANNSTSRTGRRGGRSRGRGNTAAAAADTTFVSATGDPVSGRRCYACGDPSHFANVCPNRGT